jgi:hypothetical protein
MKEAGFGSFWLVFGAFQKILTGFSLSGSFWVLAGATRVEDARPGSSGALAAAFQKSLRFSRAGFPLWGLLAVSEKPFRAPGQGFALNEPLFAYGADRTYRHNTMWIIGLTVQEIVVLVCGDMLFAEHGKKLIDLSWYFR